MHQHSEAQQKWHIIFKLQQVLKVFRFDNLFYIKPKVLVAKSPFLKKLHFVCETFYFEPDGISGHTPASCKQTVAVSQQRSQGFSLMLFKQLNLNSC